MRDIRLNKGNLKPNNSFSENTIVNMSMKRKKLKDKFMKSIKESSK